MLVANGAAGGISATFKAPIAGVIFALEVILGEFSARAFGLVVLASVSANVISRAFLGDMPAFMIPAYSLKSAWEMPLYFLLGIVAAFVAWGFVRMKVETGTEIKFIEFQVSPASKAANKKVMDLRLPKRCILVSMRRDGSILIPHGDTVVRLGDRVTALARRADRQELLEALDR